MHNIFEVIFLKKNNYTDPEVPMGLGMALAKDINAMNKFASFDSEKKKQVIDHTHQIKSKQEMAQYVQQITNETF